MKPPNKNCGFCNKPVYIPKNRESTFRYCSRSCKAKATRVQGKQKCLVCQSQFSYISSRCNTAKYCSRSCYYKSLKGKGKTACICFHCGISFQSSLSKERKFCSKKCVGKETRESWHPKYTTVRKKMILEGYINKCERCGYDKFVDVLGVHHKDRNRNNNRLENLEILCANCHSEEHSKHICH